MEYVTLGVLLSIGLISVAIYNGLIRKRNVVKNSYSQIDVQLKRRYDAGDQRRARQLGLRRR